MESVEAYTTWLKDSEMSLDTHISEDAKQRIFQAYDEQMEALRALEGISPEETKELCKDVLSKFSSDIVGEGSIPQELLTFEYVYSTLENSNPRNLFPLFELIKSMKGKGKGEEEIELAVYEMKGKGKGNDFFDEMKGKGKRKGKDQEKSTNSEDGDENESPEVAAVLEAIMTGEGDLIEEWKREAEAADLIEEWKGKAEAADLIEEMKGKGRGDGKSKKASDIASDNKNKPTVDSSVKTLQSAGWFLTLTLFFMI